MPSSSNRSTHIEEKLLRIYRLMSIRLEAADRDEPVLFMTQRFAETLDYSPRELLRMREAPLPKEFGGDPDRLDDEVSMLEEVYAEAGKITIAECIWLASSAIMDAGWCLIQVGRHDEGNCYLVWGTHLRNSIMVVPNEDAAMSGT